jgi:ribosomal protein L11 methyltransferase
MENTLGTSASVYTDARTGKSWASAYVTKTAPWNAEQRANLAQGLRAIAGLGLTLPRIQVSVAKVPPQDWSESWKRHFKALSIGRRLLILPSWSRRRPTKGQRVVILDPGLSFGTGQHPTTRHCLEQIVQARRDPQAASLLDMGCGSGILAIAAAAMGYEQVEAFDFDPAAVRATRENASRNGVERAIRISRQDLTKLPNRATRRFEVVCANLTSDLLIAHAGKIRNRLVKGGRVVVAGILLSQFGAVRRAFQKCGLRLTASKAKGEWRSGVFE